MTDHTTLELHADDNFIFAIDVSGSMQIDDCPCGLSRFQFSLEKMKQFCHEAARFENEGICIFRFGHTVTKFDHIKETDIDGIIAASSPNEGATMTDKVIAAAYDEHVEDGHDDTFLYLITDGDPTCPNSVIDVLNNISANMKGSFKVVFLIVGDASQSLKDYLKGLADRFKMVTVVPLIDANFMAVTVDAIA